MCVCTSVPENLELMDADPHRVDEDHWWTISVTAMSEADAIASARHIQERLPYVYPDAVDPRFLHDNAH
jgi:hypothetical protein